MTTFGDDPVDFDVELDVKTDPLPETSSAVIVAPLAKLGRYELLGRLASGGMADIFLARESAGGGARYVVVKLVRPVFADDKAFEELFVKEGRVAMRLAHPHICHVYQFGRVDDRYFIAMQYVNGVTLRQLGKRCHKTATRPPLALIVRIIADIAEALDFAHRLRDSRGRRIGIVHRDVSPHNIMVSFDGAVKLLDFGVAKERNDGEATTSGTVKGKFSYMSPEQCVGQPVDGRSDIFSLGVCLFEALTGRLLYKRQAQFETFKAISEGPVPSIRDVDPTLPEELDAIVQRALQKHPEARYQTAGDMQEELEEFLIEQKKVVLPGRFAGFLETIFPEEIENGPYLDRGEDVEARLEGIGSVHSISIAALTPSSVGAGRPPQAPGAPEWPEDAAQPASEDKHRVPWFVVAGVTVITALAGAAGALLGGDDEPEPEPEMVETVVVDTAQPPASHPTPAPEAEPEPVVAEPELEPEPEPEPVVAESSDDPPRVRSERSSMRTTRSSMMRRGERSQPRGFVDDPGF